MGEGIVVLLAFLANQLLGEPITASLAGGLIAVLAGIWLATTEPHHRHLRARTG